MTVTTSHWIKKNRLVKRAFVCTILEKPSQEKVNSKETFIPKRRRRYSTPLFLSLFLPTPFDPSLTLEVQLVLFPLLLVTFPLWLFLVRHLYQSKIQVVHISNNLQKYVKDCSNNFYIYTYNFPAKYIAPS